MAIVSIKNKIKSGSLRAGNTLRTPTTALTWNAITLPNVSGQFATFGNGIYVIAPYYGSTSYSTSTDGITWTSRTAPFSAVNSFGWAGSYFVCHPFGGGGSFYKSSDGISWTSGTVSGTVGVSRWNMDMAYDATLGIAVQTVNDNSSLNPYGVFCYSSDGGNSWTGSATSISYSGRNCSSDGTGRFCAGGESNGGMKSSNGTSWTSITTPWSNGHVWGGNGQFIGFTIASATSTYYLSTNGGTSWTTYSFPVSASWYSARYNADLGWILVGATTSSYRSADGITWTSATNSLSNSGTHYALVHANNKAITAPYNSTAADWSDS